MASKSKYFEWKLANDITDRAFIALNKKRIPLERMPLDHWDSSRGYSHATGWEVRLSPDPADWWYEYEDPRTGEKFLAR